MSRKTRHSYVRFYPSDWISGTFDLPRPVLSVYFQICLHNWDKGEPVSKARQALMFSDLGPQGEMIVQALVEAGKLVKNDDESVFCERAMTEANYAFDQWEKRSAGGTKGRKISGPNKTDATLPASNNLDPGATNQDEKEEANASSKNVEREAKADLAAEAVRVIEAWNVMAKSSGLGNTVQKMTDERSKRIKVRIQEHGADTLINWIMKIPQSPFLMGAGDRKWKANITWFLQPESCLKLVEGVYHNNGEGAESGWR